MVKDINQSSEIWVETDTILGHVLAIIKVKNMILISKNEKQYL